MVVFLLNVRVGKNHVTSDPETLLTVKGLTIEFLEEPAINKVGMYNGVHSPQIMSEENKRLNKGLVINPAHEEWNFISSIFLKSRPDWTNQGILNLENLNETLDYNLFIMETVHSVPHLIQQDYFMLKIDLKDAYYSVKTLEEHTKYLTFFAGFRFLKFVVLPNEFSSENKKKCFSV